MVLTVKFPLNAEERLSLSFENKNHVRNCPFEVIIYNLNVQSTTNINAQDSTGYALWPSSIVLAFDMLELFQNQISGAKLQILEVHIEIWDAKLH